MKDIKSEQQKRNNKYAYEDLLKRSWNYLKEKDIDPSTLCYGHFQNAIEGLNFTDETPEEIFNNLKKFLIDAIQRFLQSGHVGHRDILNILIYETNHASHLIEIDSIVQKAIESTQR